MKVAGSHVALIVPRSLLFTSSPASALPLEIEDTWSRSRWIVAEPQAAVVVSGSPPVKTASVVVGVAVAVVATVLVSAFVVVVIAPKA